MTTATPIAEVEQLRARVAELEALLAAERGDHGPPPPRDVPHHSPHGAPLRLRLEDLQLRYDLRTGRLYVYDPDPHALPTHSPWRLVWPRFGHTNDTPYRLPSLSTVGAHRWWDLQLRLPRAGTPVEQVDASATTSTTVSRATITGQPARRSA